MLEAKNLWMQLKNKMDDAAWDHMLEDYKNSTSHPNYSKKKLKHIENRDKLDDAMIHETLKGEYR